jgi:hypothetical protein
MNKTDHMISLSESFMRMKPQIVLIERAMAKNNHEAIAAALKVVRDAANEMIVDCTLLGGKRF